MNKISIIGLGFVGLPLACILAQKKVNQSYKYKIIGRISMDTITIDISNNISSIKPGMYIDLINYQNKLYFIIT